MWPCWLEGLKKITTMLSNDNRYLGRNSNQLPPEHKSDAELNIQLPGCEYWVPR